MSAVAPWRVGLVGAAGRMGQRVVHALGHCPSLGLHAVFVHRRAVPLPPGHTALFLRDPLALARAVDVVIDFSAPAATCITAPACAQAGTPLLVASTGLPASEREALHEAARQVPVVLAANLSVGIAVLDTLVRTAVAALPHFDVEIVESHHRHKRDAPSGTAYLLAQSAQRARASLRPLLGRQGEQAARDPCDIGLHAVRGGDVAGEHHVLLLGEGERLELVHRSHDRDVFARGALVAAQWLVGRAPGMYTMADVVAVHGSTPIA